MKLIATLRAALFYAGYIFMTVVWGTLSVLIGWLLPYRKRFAFVIGCWTRMVLWWLNITCGVRHQVLGAENIPDQACVVFVKHESTWETLFLQTLLAPQATLIKRELLRIPFFGWAFSLLKPIAIDRSKPRAALRTLTTEGLSRLQQNIWVTLFPEGTRTAPGEVRSFQAGGAALAAKSNQPLLVIAHNSGTHWPAHRFLKKPGTIDVQIAPPLDISGMTSKEINSAAEAAMRNMVNGVGPVPS